AIFAELVKIDLLEGVAGDPDAGIARARRIALLVTIGRVLLLAVRFDPKIDLRGIALVAQKQQLAPIGDQHQRIMRQAYRHPPSQSEENASSAPGLPSVLARILGDPRVALS